MYPQSVYVDANCSSVDVARSFDMRSVSANPSSYYVQKPMQNNLHVSNNFSNLQHAYSNSHASATPESHMPMNNMTSSVYETPNVRNFNSTSESVSPFYSSANNSQYMVSPSNMPIDREIGRATTSSLANYPQLSYDTPYVTNFSAPYATSEIHNSAPHLQNGYSRISGNSIGAHVPSSSVVVACGTNDWKENLAAEFKKLNALHLELQQRPMILL